MPVASIIIPCYNASLYISQTIDSACKQTEQDLEIICVDDGSTDDTLSILHKKAELDTRIKVFTQQNAGEGPAREYGRTQAHGRWLYFLDSDDLMEPTLIEKAVAQGEATRADMVIFKTRELDNQTGELRSFYWSFVTDWLQAPKGVSELVGKTGVDRIVLDGMSGVFSPREHPERIFNSFQNWVHNKLFRKSFVDARHLVFQPVHRTADLLFVCRALAEADRIALLDEELHQYRVNNTASALFTSDSYPLDFYEAFCELKDSLEKQGTWTLYRDSFVNWVQEGVAMNLQRARSYEGFMQIVHTMRDENGLARLGFLQSSRSTAINPDRWDRCYAILHSSTEELLFLYFSLERAEVMRAQTQNSQQRLDIRHAYETCRPMRIGKAVARFIDRPGISNAVRVLHIKKLFGL